MKEPEIDALTEQLRREIRERMDIFLNDATDLAKKYCGQDAVKQDPTLAFPIAAALSQHFAAHIVANALRENTAAARELVETTGRLVDETKETSASMRMLAAWRQNQGR